MAEEDHLEYGGAKPKARFRSSNPTDQTLLFDHNSTPRQTRDSHSNLFNSFSNGIIPNTHTQIENSHDAFVSAAPSVDEDDKFLCSKFKRPEQMQTRIQFGSNSLLLPVSDCFTDSQENLNFHNPMEINGDQSSIAKTCGLKPRLVHTKFDDIFNEDNSSSRPFVRGDSCMNGHPLQWTESEEKDRLENFGTGSPYLPNHGERRTAFKVRHSKERTNLHPVKLNASDRENTHSVKTSALEPNPVVKAGLPPRSKAKRGSYPQVEKEELPLRRSYSEKVNPNNSTSRFKLRNQRSLFNNQPDQSSQFNGQYRLKEDGKRTTYPHMSSYSSEDEIVSRASCDRHSDPELKQESLIDKWKRSGTALRKFISDKFHLSKKSSLKESSKTRSDGPSWGDTENDLELKPCMSDQVDRQSYRTFQNKDSPVLSTSTNRKHKEMTLGSPTNSLNSCSGSSSPTKSSDKSKRFFGSFWRRKGSSSKENSFENELLSGCYTPPCLNSNKRSRGHKTTKGGYSALSTPSSESSVTDTSSMNNLLVDTDDSSTNEKSRNKTQKWKKKFDSSKLLEPKTKVSRLHTNISLFDRELSSSEESLINREKASSSSEGATTTISQENVTPHGTPPAPALSRGSTEALPRLRYALPFLPERFRSGISTAPNRDDVNNPSRPKDKSSNSRTRGCRRGMSRHQSHKRGTGGRSKRHEGLSLSGVESACVCSCQSPSELPRRWSDSLFSDRLSMRNSCPIHCSNNKSSPNTETSAFMHDENRNGGRGGMDSHLNGGFSSRSRTHGEISGDCFPSAMHRRTPPREEAIRTQENSVIRESDPFGCDLIDSINRSFLQENNSVLQEDDPTLPQRHGDIQNRDNDDYTEYRMLGAMVDTMNVYVNAISGLCESVNTFSLDPTDEEAPAPVHKSDPETSSMDDLDCTMSMSSHLVSSDSGEADDEFECDCSHCQLQRQQERPPSSDPRPLDDLSFSIGSRSPFEERLSDVTSQNFGLSDPNSDSTVLWLPDADPYNTLFRINVIELTPLTPLDFMLMAESRFMLDLMFENVILQMLAVHPELLNDQAPLPAASTVIDSLPTLHVTAEDIEQTLSCPICLCPCELQEKMSKLPCQHLFHPLCIRAWLVKSGTCPVCRQTL